MPSPEDWNTSPVGAGLLANAECQPTLLSTERTPSRASPLPQFVQRLTTLTKREAAVSSMRRLVKSNRLRSASCDGCTFCRLRKILSVRPGVLRSHSCSMSLTTWRCRFSWEPEVARDDRELFEI